MPLPDRLLGRLALPAAAVVALFVGPASANREQLAAADKDQAVETRVKIVPKPVPCVPCPCECPEVRPGQALASAPVSAPPAPLDDPRASEPRAQKEPEARPAPPPPPARGNIVGEVIIRDRGGKERTDKSDVVVYIEKMPLKKFAALKRSRKMAQRDKSFTPKVLAVTKGSAVEFPNEDKFFHNVFSLSEGNTFDLGLYRAGTSKTVTFEKSGVVDVYCNIHPNMWAQILVLENPFYAVTAKEGTYEIPKVPAGTYTLVAWTSGGDPVKQPVRVDPGGKATVKFELREGVASKPHLNKFNQPYGRYK